MRPLTVTSFVLNVCQASSSALAVTETPSSRLPISVSTREVSRLLRDQQLCDIPMHLEDLPLEASAEALTIDVGRVTASTKYLVSGMMVAIAAAEPPEHLQHHGTPSETSSSTSIPSVHANLRLETAPAPSLLLPIPKPTEHINDADSVSASPQEIDLPYEDDRSLSPSGTDQKGTIDGDASPPSPPPIGEARRPSEEGGGSGDIPSETLSLGESEEDATAVQDHSSPSRATDVGGTSNGSLSEAELKPEGSTTRGNSPHAVANQAEVQEAWKQARAMEASLLLGL